MLNHLFSEHAFFVLACLPGFIALFNLIAVKRDLENTKRNIKKLKRKSRSGKQAHPAFQGNLSEFAPRVWYTIFGVVSLTTVFAIVAFVGGDGPPRTTDFGVGKVPARQAEPAPGQPTPPTAIRSPQAGPINTSGQTGQHPSAGSGTSPHSPVALQRGTQDASRAVSGLAGLVYAGYGAYIYTLLLVISRLNSAALTGQFLALSAVRSAIALVLGFAAADTNIFNGLSQNQGLFVLFFLGLFPSWAMDALRQKARQIFKPAAEGADPLPLCLIDGLDDGIADRLSEVGIWDIQHVANSDPNDLSDKTLYPLHRIIDWIDQAILISYVRSQIVHFRACGVKGAIDFAALYSDAMAIQGAKKRLSQKTKALRARALALIKVLAQKTNFSEDALRAIGRTLLEDAVVQSIWNLWFDEE